MRILKYKIRIYYGYLFEWISLVFDGYDFFFYLVYIMFLFFWVKYEGLRNIFFVKLYKIKLLYI